MMQINTDNKQENTKVKSSLFFVLLSKSEIKKRIGRIKKLNLSSILKSASFLFTEKK
jgi:hypothetical protein